MNEPDITVPENRTPESSDGGDLKQECQDLRRQVSMLLLTFTVASFTLTAYLGLQDIRAGRDLDAVRRQRAQLAEQTRMELTGVQAFLAKISEYGQTHLDFQPILTKYKIEKVTTASNALPVAPAPTPAPPAAQPKK